MAEVEPDVMFGQGNEALYSGASYPDTIFFAPDTKQILLDGIAYIPKKLSELTNDKGFQKGLYDYVTISGIADTAILPNLLAPAKYYNSSGGLEAIDYDSFKFFDTKFYASLSSTANRAQVAYGYSKDAIHFRRYFGGKWYDWKQVAFTDGTVATANNALLLAGMDVSSLPAYWNRTYRMLDLSDTTVYDPYKWYPCLMAVSPKYPTRIRIWNSLGLTAEEAPEWASHDNGFTLNLEWSVTGWSWGTTTMKRMITAYNNGFTTDGYSPCGGIDQNMFQNLEVVWLRGGAKYYYQSDNNGTFTPYKDGYEWSSANGANSFSAPVRTSGDIVSPTASRNGSVLSVSLIYADSVSSNTATIGTLTATTLKAGTLTSGRATFDGIVDIHDTAKTGTVRIVAESGNCYIEFGDYSWTASASGFITGRNAEKMDMLTLFATTTKASGALNVVGNTALGGTLTVSGKSTLNGNVDVWGKMTINSADGIPRLYASASQGSGTAYPLIGLASNFMDIEVGINPNSGVTQDGELYLYALSKIYAMATLHATTIEVTNLKIGNATLSYDATNGCVKIDKGFSSDSYVSAKGVDATTSDLEALEARIAELESQIASLTNN